MRLRPRRSDHIVRHRAAGWWTEQGLLVGITAAQPSRSPGIL